MKDLINALRYCAGSGEPCAGCPYYKKYPVKDCMEKIMLEAAKAMEDAEREAAKIRKRKNPQWS